MGVRGLGGYLKWRVPGARRPICWSVHAGETWAIDCSCILFRARGAGLDPRTVLASLLVRMRRFGITPIVVFDGRTPVAKAAVVQQRREVRSAVQDEMRGIRESLDVSGAAMSETTKVALEQRMDVLKATAPTVTREDRDDVKRFLYAAGVLAVTAEHEADDLLAWLARQKVVSAVVSTDLDMLARGIPLLVVPESPDTTLMAEVSLAGVLGGLGLPYPQFVEACMLMGTDYTPRSCHRLAPPAAVEAAGRGIHWERFVSLEEYEQVARGIRLLTGAVEDEDSEDADALWKSLLNERQREKWTAGAPACEPEALGALRESLGWPMDWVSALTRA